MLVDPAPVAVARPCDPAVLLMVATPKFEEAQATDAVRSCVELSVYVPVAVNCCVNPFGMLATLGDTWIETSAAVVTVSVAGGDVTPLRLALMLVVPTLDAEAKPYEPEAL